MTSKGEKTVYVDWLSLWPWMLLDIQLTLSDKEIRSLLPYAGKCVKFDVLGIHKEIVRKFN